MKYFPSADSEAAREGRGHLERDAPSPARRENDRVARQDPDPDRGEADLVTALDHNQRPDGAAHDGDQKTGEHSRHERPRLEALEFGSPNDFRMDRFDELPRLRRIQPPLYEAADDRLLVDAGLRLLDDECRMLDALLARRRAVVRHGAPLLRM